MPNPARIRPRNWAETALVSAAALVVAILYAWTATDGRWHFGTRGPKKNLYEQQVEGFHAGRLSLLAQPDPALLALPNPYDPAQNHGTRVLDVSLFEGRYYT